MFDTRLINQVVEWERRIEIENEKNNNHQPATNPGFPIILEFCRQLLSSTMVRIGKLSHRCDLAIHSSEPA